MEITLAVESKDRGTEGRGGWGVRTGWRLGEESLEWHGIGVQSVCLRPRAEVI